MSWADSFIKPEDQLRIEAAVQEAEKNTSGEIVPMIVRRSASVGHVGPLLFLIFLILGLLFFIFLSSQWTAVEEFLYIYFSDQISTFSFFLGFGVMWIITSVFLAKTLSQIAGLQRLLTDKRDLELQVLERAQLEFYWSRTHRTVNRTGVLLFISLMEHRCVVLADEVIASRLPPETWRNLVDQLIVSIKARQSADGLITAIHQCGDILSRHFPRPAGDRNELSNLLIIKE